MRQVKCTVTMKANKLECVMMIGETGHDWWWQRVNGRFSLGPATGKWMYASGRGGVVGVGLAHTNDPDRPSFSFPGNVIAILNGVPEHFLDLIRPGKPLSGEGIIRLNNIALLWEISVP